MERIQYTRGSIKTPTKKRAIHTVEMDIISVKEATESIKGTIRGTIEKETIGNILGATALEIIIKEAIGTATLRKENLDIVRTISRDETLVEDTENKGLTIERETMVR